MFTEGLDPHALRWIREQRTDSLHVLPNGVRGLGIPPPEKFRSGHLPRTSIPLSRTMPVEEYSELGSDMDVSSDTDEDGYAGKYSLESSPTQNGLSRRSLRNGTTGAGRKIAFYSDCYSDNSSSVEAAGKPVRQHGKPVRKQWKQGSMGGYTEEEEDGSPETCGNSGFGRSLRREEVNGVGDSTRGRYTEENCSSKSHFSDREAVSAGKGRPVDIPSAPPFHYSPDEISQPADTVTNSRACDTSSVAGFNDYSGKVGISSQSNSGSTKHNQNIRSGSAGVETSESSKFLSLKIPTFHACGQGPWHSVIAYDACVRLCLHSWARGCMEAPIFLENECSLLRNAFGLQYLLLQSEEELLEKRSSEPEVAAVKPKKIIGKMKVQIRKVKMTLDMPSGCNYLSLRIPPVKLESFRYRMSNFQSTLSSGWESLQKVRVLPHPPANSSFSKQSLAYMQATTQYIKHFSVFLKTGVSSLRSPSADDVVQESFSCFLRLKSLAEEDRIQMQVGSGETHVFFPDSTGDDLIVEVHDSKGKSLGRVVVQLAIIAEDPSNKVSWQSIYKEPEHELVGRIQLYVNYSTTDDNSSLKCGSVAETVAYDIVLEIAMKVQHFQQRSLLLHGPWKWLLTEFASYYGVSNAYTRLRYLSYIMDVATPTADCLILVHDLLAPVILKSGGRKALSHQENRILGEIEEQIERILAMVFENYKSLDESAPSGLMEVFRPASGTPAAAFVPAVNLYKLLHDILSPEVQLKLCSYFQVASKKRSRRHLSETDEFIGSCTGGFSASSSGGSAMQAPTFIAAYEKMKNLCFNIRNEIFTDIEIHDQHLLPSFVDLRSISASIYSVELCKRLREFLIACPPPGPSPHVAALVISTADFQKDLISWNICHVKDGVDAKELFHLYIIFWIQDKRLQLLESCKLDKVKWSVRTQHMTTPFIDSMYDLLRETLIEYEVIICRWPEYVAVLENAIADVEKAVIEALEKQYGDALAPLKDALIPKKFGLKYVQKLASRSNAGPYTVPNELGVLLNSMKRLLDVLRPKVELQFKSWATYIPDGGNIPVGEHLSEVTVTLRAKFRNYMQAVVEKLVENSRAQSATKLKRIIQDSKDVLVESDIRNRMQPLKDLLVEIINHLHTILDVQVFVSLCRCFWDRMGQDVLNFLEDRKENKSWYKSARITVAILDDTFASQMQQLLGNALHAKDLEPPRSIMEVRSVLCKDVSSHDDSKFYY